MKVILSGNMVDAPKMQSNKDEDLAYVTGTLAENYNNKTEYYNLLAFDTEDSVTELVCLEKGQLTRVEGILECKPYLNPKTYVIGIRKTIKYISKLSVLDEETNKMKIVYEK